MKLVVNSENENLPLILREKEQARKELRAAKRAYEIALATKKFKSKEGQQMIQEALDKAIYRIEQLNDQIFNIRCTIPTIERLPGSMQPQPITILNKPY